MLINRTTQLSLQVAPADRAAVIDLCNRLNMATDQWDIETMIGLFAEDGAVSHPRGELRGHNALREFYEGYRPLTIGSRRHALNHVVDGNRDGTISVTYYMMIVRVSDPKLASEADKGSLTESYTGLPGIFIHSVVTCRFRRDAGHDWRYVEYSADSVVANHALRMEE